MEPTIIQAIALIALMAACMLTGWALADSANARARKERDYYKDKFEGTEADLDYAVEVAFNRGATEFVRLNYPKHFAKLSAPKTEDTTEEWEGPK